MLRLIFTRMSQSFAVVMAMWLFISPLTALAAERIRIPADPCGPMAALQNAGHSVKLVSFLQHEDGSPLIPSEVRSTPDKDFYLPADATPDAAKFSAFISREVETLGLAPKTGPCFGPMCPEELAEAKKKVADLEDKLGSAQKAIDGEMKVRMKADLDLVEEKQRNESNVSWWWLLLALLPGLGLAGYAFHLRGENQRLEQTLADNPSQLAQARERIDQLRVLLQQLNARVDQLSEHLDEANARWNNVDVVRSRLAQLENPPVGPHRQ